MKGAIKNTFYNKILKENPDFKDFPSRENAIIGSTHPKGAMFTVGDVKGSEIEEDRTFIMIPYDNVKIAIAPVMDLQGLRRNMSKMDVKYFHLLKYTKNFKLSFLVKNIKNIENIPISQRNAKEIWTEGPVLLLRYSSINRLKELIEQRS